MKWKNLFNIFLFDLKIIFMQEPNSISNFGGYDKNYSLLMKNANNMGKDVYLPSFSLFYFSLAILFFESNVF